MTHPHRMLDDRTGQWANGCVRVFFCRQCVTPLVFVSSSSSVLCCLVCVCVCVRIFVWVCYFVVSCCVVCACLSRNF